MIRLQNDARDLMHLGFRPIRVVSTPDISCQVILDDIEQAADPKEFCQIEGGGKLRLIWIRDEELRLYIYLKYPMNASPFQFRSVKAMV